MPLLVKAMVKHINKKKTKNYEKIKSNDDDTNDVFNDNGIFWTNIKG